MLENIAEQRTSNNTLSKNEEYGTNADLPRHIHGREAKKVKMEL